MEVIFKIILVVVTVLLALVGFTGLFALFALPIAALIYVAVPWLFSIPTIPFVKVWVGSILGIWLLQLFRGQVTIKTNHGFQQK